MQNIDELLRIVPNEIQLKWQNMEFYAFFHFGMNTFTNKEWGNGKEDINIFNLKNLNTDQWAETIKNAGMKGAIITAKHHDGFCLWQTETTEHSIKNTIFQNGKGDIVKSLQKSCEKFGLKLGIYLSPWDQNSKFYGTEKYNDFFIAQLTELLTNYGELFEVWFDGACGEGENGKKQTYDWERYWNKIRELQPSAAISIVGPDVRWIGNEGGESRESEWSVVPSRLGETSYIAQISQKKDGDINFLERKISTMDSDLGSREFLKNEKDLKWYPAETDVSIRPGWFYHPEEDTKVRTLENLLDIYYHSVGGNSNLLLNIPPTPEGIIHKNDVEILIKLGKYLNEIYCSEIDSSQIKINFEKKEKNHEIKNNFSGEKIISHIILKEDITKSQRIEKFEIFTIKDNNKIIIYNGTTIGARKICKIEPIKVDNIVINILETRGEPFLNFIKFYQK